MVKTTTSLSKKQMLQKKSAIRNALAQRRIARQRDCSKPCSSAGQSINNVQKETPIAEIDKVTVLCKCRLCLKEIYSHATPIWGVSGIYEKVIRCSSVMVLETDMYQFVCPYCNKHLEYINKFQQICLKSNEIFLKLGFLKEEDSLNQEIRREEEAFDTTTNIESEGKEEVPLPDSLNQGDIVIEPPSKDKFKSEEIHLDWEEEAIDTATNFESEGKEEDSLPDSSNQDEIVIEPPSADKRKLEETHPDWEEDVIDTATNFESEDEMELEYPCIQCPMISFEVQDYLVHQKSHMERPKRFTRIDLCPICGKTLKIKMFLKHIRAHTHPQQPVECDECGKMLSGPNAIRHHKLKSHRPKVLHDCTLCGSKLATKGGLKHHMLTVHDKQSPISCMYCDRKFNNRYNMRVHLRTHTGEMPYACPDCGISFAHRVTMKLHRLKEHKVNMFDPPTQKEGLKKKKKTNKKTKKTPNPNS